MATTTGGPIQRLDEFTVAQIRAGESIEHPAAVVKEAIENAIDAGASSIRVEIRAGGKREIRISDNGSGIPADQIELAFERHTTSKLRQADDLFAVFTLGFRGEALASMASVAQVTCVSRTADAEVGTEVRLARGKVISRTPRGTPPGTTLLIQNLFGEVPVRLKFLKSDAAEAARVTDVVQHAALSRPEIRWTLVTDGREQLQTSGNGDVRDVMLTIYGPEVVRDLLPVDDQDGTGELATRVSGWISMPNRTLGTRKGMYLFVNSRPIQAASSIGAAIQDAYFHQLPSGRYPYVCLSIEVDPGAVDVNVHPSKREVKLQFSDRVIGLIGRAVRTALSDNPVPIPADEQPSARTPEKPQLMSRYANVHSTDTRAPNVVPPTARPPADAATFQSRTTPSQSPLSLDEQAPVSRSAALSSPAPQPSPVARKSASRSSLKGRDESLRQPATSARVLKQAQAPLPIQADQADTRIAEETITHAENTPPARKVQHTTAQDQSKKSEQSSTSVLPELRLIGQHEQTWILASAPGMLYLIDQHRAHERVIYERLLRDAGSGPLPQRQTVPQEVVLPPEIADSLADHRRELAAVGLAIAPAATGRIVVSAAPAVMDSADMQAFLIEVGSWLVNSHQPRQGEWRDQILATIACHSSIRPGQALSFAEMQDLLVQLQGCKNAERCPHGHAVTSVILTSWLEQQFRLDDET